MDDDKKQSEIAKLLRTLFEKDDLISLTDACNAAALQAARGIDQGFPYLSPVKRRAHQGAMRFTLTEGVLVQWAKEIGLKVCEPKSIIPEIGAEIFQPVVFAKSPKGFGVYLNIARSKDITSIPRKCKTRKKLSKLNEPLDKQLELNLELDSKNDHGEKYNFNVSIIFVPDYHNPGKINQIFIAVIDSKYKEYIFKMEMGRFISGYEDAHSQDSSPPDPKAGGPSSAKDPNISMKKNVKPFTPPESPHSKPGEEPEQKK